MAVKMVKKSFIHPDLCAHVMKGLLRLHMWVERPDVVTGSGVDREVMTIND